MTKLLGLGIAAALAIQTSAAMATAPARILTNHLGYELFEPKLAVIQGEPGDAFSQCVVRSWPAGALIYEAKVSPQTQVQDWRDWRFWTLDLGAVQQPGQYVIECANGGQANALVRSHPFAVQKNLLERHTLADVIAYFKAERVSGDMDKADRHLRFDGADRAPIDAHGGWYDATGDYGVHFSQLDFTSYFNTQQVPLVVYALGRSAEMLAARHDANFTQIDRRLLDEMSYGADFLVRMHRAGHSFYETIDAPGPGKKAADRRIGRSMTRFGIKQSASDSSPDGHGGTYEVSFRNGGGFAIAGLAMAARLGVGGDFSRAQYLKTAEEAFAYLAAHNQALTNDGVENIVDDYSALVAATELMRTTGKPVYAAAARQRADNLMSRLASDGHYTDYWRRGAKGGQVHFSQANDGQANVSRAKSEPDPLSPFFHPSDAGAPVVALVRYAELADAPTRARIATVVRRSLGFELGITGEVANPFGLARQYVQNKAGVRRGAFFFPHDTETAPWWQGENARLASLAAAARVAEPLYADDPAFQAKLAAYATDQLDWILGENPFDASMMQGVGRNNPQYGFFGSWQYTQTPGGIVNGITSGYADGRGIDFNLSYAQTGKDDDWRWSEQWLPHAAWYLFAVAARPVPAATGPKQVIGYVYTNNQPLDPAKIPAAHLTVLNYAFTNIVDGRLALGTPLDAANIAAMQQLRSQNPKLKLMISVGGWVWSGGFSDMALTPASRARFIQSAVTFVHDHQLDGLDVDWEYPGQRGNGNVNRPEDKQHYTALMTELRAALDTLGKADGKHYLLTTATGAAQSWLDHTEMAKVARVVDYVNLMNYDQYGDADAATGHNGPLYTSPYNPKGLSAATVVNLYLAAGVPAAKIVLGVPFYGQAWSKVPATNNGLYQSGTFLTGFDNTYGAISAIVGKDGYTRHWDAASAEPYLYNPARGIFVSYDDPQAMALKAQYVLDRGLAGIMFWELSNDPKRVLLDAVWDGLHPATH